MLYTVNMNQSEFTSLKVKLPSDLATRVESIAMDLGTTSSDILLIAIRKGLEHANDEPPQKKSRRATVISALNPSKSEMSCHEKQTGPFYKSHQ